MCALYLSGIFSEEYASSPGRVKITFPVVTNLFGGKPEIYNDTVIGLLTTEPSISTNNKWGPILGDISSLTFLTSLIGSQNLVSWVGASAQCWKGTDPIRMSFEFYLINYKRGLKLEEKIKNLTKLTSLSQSGNDYTQSFTVQVHSGYATDALRNNMEFFSNGGLTKEETLKRGESYLSKPVTGVPGTCIVEIGSRIRIKNLLVARIDVTPSVTEVFSLGEPTKPLYYRVGISMLGIQPLLSTDVEEMFL